MELLKKYSSKSYHALEIGCGGGRVTSQGADWLGHIDAADVSREMLRKCHESVDKKNIRYHHLDAFMLKEFKENSVDFIYSHDVFVHFSSMQVYPYFIEIKRVLKKGGLAMVSFYNLDVHFHYFKERSLRFNRERRFPPHMRIHFVTEEMLRIMLDDLSLEVIEIEKQNFLIAVFRKS